MQLSNSFKECYTVGFHPQIMFKSWPKAGDLAYLHIGNVGYYIEILEDLSDMEHPIFKIKYLSRMCDYPITFLEGIPFNTKKSYTWVLYQYQPSKR